METTYIRIDGVVILPNGETHDEFWTEFIKLIESKGWSFMGRTSEIDKDKDEE